MRDYRNAKAMAKSLRDGLTDKGIDLTHSECLELVARALGVADWNTLAAAIATDDTSRPPAEAGGAPTPSFKRQIPILRIFDVDKAKEFYVDFLGFTIEWEHRFHANAPLYAQVSKGELVLHLSEHHGDASPGATVFVWMRGIVELHRELSQKAYRYNRPGLEAAPWDARVMEVNDPFGNRLRFSEPNRADDPRA
jgi:uncharacterized glyoxalase superfamily protein PhnB